MSGVAISLVAPKSRKHLSANALFGLVRSGYADVLDDCLIDTDIACTDALMSAFAMFSLTSPLLLAFDKQRVEGNLGRIYGMEHVPCATQIWESIDPVSPFQASPIIRWSWRIVTWPNGVKSISFGPFLATEGP
jgi:hypothetical protein